MPVSFGCQDSSRCRSVRTSNPPTDRIAVESPTRPTRIGPVSPIGVKLIPSRRANAAADIAQNAKSGNFLEEKEIDFSWPYPGLFPARSELPRRPPSAGGAWGGDVSMRQVELSGARTEAP